MINRIRIGNDINIEFTILINKGKDDISDAKNITVNVFREENVNDSIELTGLDISSNPIKFTITGNIEHKSGLYRCLITYNKTNPIENEPDIFYAVDAPVFRLVSWSGQQQIGNEIPIMIPPVLIEGSILQVASNGSVGSGRDGISVTNAEIDNRGHLIIMLSDGRQIDTGKAVGKDGEPGTTIHSELSDLDFEDSGHTGFASKALVDELIWQLDTKAPINSPDFTGIPTASTPDIDNRTLQIANTTFVKDVVKAHDDSTDAHEGIRAMFPTIERL